MPSSPPTTIDPGLLKFLKEKMERYFGSNSSLKLMLFGSRARGDHGDRSDFDLAFLIDPPDSDAWVRFVDDVREHAPTLKGLDLVNLADCQKDLRERVVKEGRVIYERARK